MIQSSTFQSNLKGAIFSDRDKVQSSFIAILEHRVTQQDASYEMLVVPQRRLVRHQQGTYLLYVHTKPKVVQALTPVGHHI